MIIYKCNNCHKYILSEDLEYRKVSKEEMYGVSDLFQNKSYIEMPACPHCDSWDVNEIEDYEVIELLNKEG